MRPLTCCTAAYYDLQDLVCDKCVGYGTPWQTPIGHKEIVLEQCDHEVVKCDNFGRGPACFRRPHGESRRPCVDDFRNSAPGCGESRHPLFLHADAWAKSWSQ